MNMILSQKTWKKWAEQRQRQYKKPHTYSSSGNENEQTGNEHHSDTHTNTDNSYLDPNDILTPHQLLSKLGIESRKDWKKWILRNHPDKNPGADILLVQLVNAAINTAHPDQCVFSGYLLINIKKKMSIFLIRLSNHKQHIYSQPAMARRV